MHKTYVIGDIHSGLRALKQVLDLVPKASDNLYIFLGDYVDGWSEASETVDFLIDFSENNNCILLRGNHDELVYNFLKDKNNNPMWLAHGGESSKKSYANVSARVPPEASRPSQQLASSAKAMAARGRRSRLAEGQEGIKRHLQFYEELQNYYIDSENRLYLHAGFTNLHGPAHEYFKNSVYWDRTLWEMACSLDPLLSKTDSHYPKRLLLFSEIYIGHTPVTKIGKTIPVNYANVWNIDTGAAFKGPLSIIEVNSKEVWQSDPVWKLYPGEEGRNK